MLSAFFIVGLAVLYAALLAWYVWNWRKIPLQLTPTFTPSTRVSVVIAAKNEGGNIHTCLNSLTNQDYPDALWELWVVDDHSTDNTWGLASGFEKAKLLKNEGWGKKMALMTAIHQSNGELIVTTDADCLSGTGWISSIVADFERNRPACICGPVAMAHGTDLFTKFQSLDFCGMNVVNAAGIGSGLMQLGNGANLAFTKDAFFSVGGYEGNLDKASGDDVFLVSKIAQKFKNGVVFLKNTSAIVETSAMPGLASFWHQRLRWGNKTSSLKQPLLQATAGGVWFFCVVLALTPAVLVFRPELWVAMASAWLFKAIADYLLLSYGTKFFNKHYLLSSFAPSFILHTLYIAFLGTASVLKFKYKWK